MPRYCAADDLEGADAPPNTCTYRDTRHSSSPVAMHVTFSAGARCGCALATSATVSATDDKFDTAQRHATLPLNRCTHHPWASIVCLPENVLATIFLYCDANSLLQVCATCYRLRSLFSALLLNGAPAFATGDPAACECAGEGGGRAEYTMSPLLAILAEWHNTGVMTSRVGDVTLYEWFTMRCAMRRWRELLENSSVSNTTQGCEGGITAHSLSRANDRAACLRVVREWLGDLQHRRATAQNVQAGRFCYTRFEQSATIYVAPLLLANGLLCVLTRPRRVTLFARDVTRSTRQCQRRLALRRGCHARHSYFQDDRDEDGTASPRWRPVAEIETVFAVTGVFDDATRNMLLVSSMYTPVTFYSLHTLVEQCAGRRLWGGETRGVPASPWLMPTTASHAASPGGKTNGVPASVCRVESVCYSDFARVFLRVRHAVFSALEEWTWSRAAVLLVVPQGRSATEGADATTAVKVTVLWRNTDVTECLGLPLNMTTGCDKAQLAHQINVLQGVANELSRGAMADKDAGVALDVGLTEYDLVAMQYVSEQTSSVSHRPNPPNDAAQTITMAPFAASPSYHFYPPVTQGTHYVLGVYNEQCTLMLAASMDEQVVLFVTSRHTMKELCSVTVEGVRDLAIVHHPRFDACPAGSGGMMAEAVRRTACLRRTTVCRVDATEETKSDIAEHESSSAALDEPTEEGQAMVAVGTWTATLLYAAQLRREVRSHGRVVTDVVSSEATRLPRRCYVTKGYYYTSGEAYMTPLYRFDHTGPCVFAPAWTPTRAVGWRGGTATDRPRCPHGVSHGGRAPLASPSVSSSHCEDDISRADWRGGSGHPFFHTPFVVFVSARRLCLGFWRAYTPLEQQSFKPQATRMWCTFDLASLGATDVRHIDAAAVDDDTNISYDPMLRAMLSDVTAVSVSPTHAFLILGTRDGHLMLLAPNLTVTACGEEDGFVDAVHGNDGRRGVTTRGENGATSDGADEHPWRVCNLRRCCRCTSLPCRVGVTYETQRGTVNDSPFALPPRGWSARAARAVLLRRPFGVSEVFGPATTEDSWLRTLEERWTGAVAPSLVAPREDNTISEHVPTRCWCDQRTAHLLRVPLFLCHLRVPSHDDGDTVTARDTAGERTALSSSTTCAIISITIDGWRLTTMCAARTVRVYDLQASLMSGQATQTARTTMTTPSSTSNSSERLSLTDKSYTIRNLLQCSVALLTLLTVSLGDHPCCGVATPRGSVSRGSCTRHRFGSAGAGGVEGDCGVAVRSELCWRDGVLLLHSLPFPWMCSVLDFDSVSLAQPANMTSAQADCVPFRAPTVRTTGVWVVRGFVGTLARIAAALCRFKRTAKLRHARRRVSCSRGEGQSLMVNDGELCAYPLPCHCSAPRPEINRLARSKSVFDKLTGFTYAVREPYLLVLQNTEDNSPIPLMPRAQRVAWRECRVPHLRLVSGATWVNIVLRALAPLAVFPVAVCILCFAYNVDRHQTVVPRWAMCLLWTPVPFGRGLYVITRYQCTRAEYGVALCLQDVIVVLLGLVGGPLSLILHAPFTEPTPGQSCGQVAVCISTALILCVATHAQRRYFVRRGHVWAWDVMHGAHFIVAALCLCTIALFALFLRAPAGYTHNRVSVLAAFIPMFGLYYATTMYCAHYCFVTHGSIVVPVIEMLLFLLTVYPALHLFYVVSFYWKWATQGAADNRPSMLPSVVTLSLIMCTMCLLLLRKNSHYLLLLWRHQS